jgi:hypothetical protein
MALVKKRIALSGITIGRVGAAAGTDFDIGGPALPRRSSLLSRPR